MSEQRLMEAETKHSWLKHRIHAMGKYQISTKSPGPEDIYMKIVEIYCFIARSRM